MGECGYLILRMCDASHRVGCSGIKVVGASISRVFFSPKLYEEVRWKMAEKGESSDEEPTIAEDVVVTKYKMAGDMANSECV